MEFTEAWDDACSSVSVAVRMGNIKILRRLLKSGKPLDVHDNRGWRALHEAAACEQLECLEELLKYDVNVNWQNYENETALMIACKKGNPRIVQVLLEHNADPNIKMHDGTTTLIAAVIARNIECVKLLLQSGAEVDSSDWVQWSAIHHAAELGDVEILKLLAENSSDLNSTRDCYLRTPLFIAAENGNLECLKFLFEKLSAEGDASAVNGTTVDGMSPLGITAQNAHFSCLEFLIERGADVNYVTPDGGLLALHFAITNSDFRCFELLLNLTDFEILKKSTTFSVLHLAVDRSRHSAIAMLLEKKFPVDQLEAVPDLDLASDILIRKFVLSEMGDDSSFLYITALGLAARKGDLESVNLLIDAGANCNVNKKKSIPPLVGAVWGGNSEIVEKLLLCGSDVNYSQLTSLPIASVVAVHERNWSIFELLLQYGARNFAFQDDHGDDFLWQTIHTYHDSTSILEQVLSILWRYENFSKWHKMYRFACANHQSNEDDWSSELRTLTAEIPKLQHLCRIVVRECLVSLKPSLIPSEVLKLHIPQTLRDYVMYK